jgi:hypothetical protein
VFVTKRISILIAIVFLLIASQLTRFENELIVTYDGENITAEANQARLSLTAPSADFSKISAAFQKSIASETGLKSLIIQSDGKEVYSRNKFVFFFSGYDVFGTLVKGKYPGFKRTFGDWSMDRFRSPDVTLYDQTLPFQFKIYSSFVGRGEKILYLDGSKKATIDIRDGFLDNDFSICMSGVCNSTSPTENSFTNLLRYLNFFVEGSLIAAVLFLASSFFVIGSSKENSPKANRKTLFFVILLAFTHFAISAYFSTEILGSIPHIPDDAAYFREGVLLSNGQLYISNFTSEPATTHGLELSSFLRNGNLYYVFNHFWPTLLAIPITLNIAEFLNPFLSAISLILVYLIAVRLYNRRVGCIAALIYCISPFMIIMAGSFMTHTATQLCMLTAFYFLIVYVQNQKPIAAMLSGFFIAYGLGLRQVTAVAFAAPIFVYFLLFHRRSIINSKSFWFLIGFLPVFGLFLVDNYIITGNALLTPHQAFSHHAVTLSNLPRGLNWMDSNLGALPPILFYEVFPMMIIGLSFFPLIAYRKKEDYLLIAIFVSLLVAYSLPTVDTGLHGYGPRFLFESLFIFFILSARAIEWILNNSRNTTKGIVICLLIVLFINNAYGLVTILPSYTGYNGIHPEIVQEFKKVDLSQSLILIPSFSGWHMQGITATLMDEELRYKPFIYAQNDMSHELIIANTALPVYVLNGSKLALLQNINQS